MMNFEEDWLMRQIRQGSTSIGYILSKLQKNQDNQVEIQQFQDESGRVVKQSDYLDQLVQHYQFQEAFEMIQQLKFQLSFHDHTILSSAFIDYLHELPQAIKSSTGLTESKINEYQAQLTALI